MKLFDSSVVSLDKGLASANFVFNQIVDTGKSARDVTESKFGTSSDSPHDFTLVVRMEAISHRRIN